jgi:hypothetical protein
VGKGGIVVGTDHAQARLAFVQFWIGLLNLDDEVHCASRMQVQGANGVLDLCSGVPRHNE